MKSTKTIRLLLLLLWSIILYLLAGTTAFAQTAQVSGTVINERTSAPAVGATITVKNTNRFHSCRSRPENFLSKRHPAMCWSLPW